MDVHGPVWNTNSARFGDGLTVSEAGEGTVIEGYASLFGAAWIKAEMWCEKGAYCRLA